MEKQILVVGGSTGIGRAVVEGMTDAKVHCWSRESRGVELLKGIHWSQVDIENDTPLPELPSELYGLVYAPGTINLKPFRGLKPADWERDLKVNLFGAIRVLQHAEAALKAGRGSVVLFSTVAVAVGMPFHASIAAAKGAIEGLGRSLAAEWAPTIRVNIVAPSLTHTPLASKLLDGGAKEEAAAGRHPLKRVGSAEEVAACVRFLLSEGAAGMSGQILRPDGGMQSLKTF
jgi:3-oxoacyl-[acyl-carrier protein] reductase